jgi:hypothetical protein
MCPDNRRDRLLLLEKVSASLPTCPISEVARLGRNLRVWRPAATCTCRRYAPRLHATSPESSDPSSKMQSPLARASTDRVLGLRSQCCRRARGAC